MSRNHDPQRNQGDFNGKIPLPSTSSSSGKEHKCCLFCNGSSHISVCGQTNNTRFNTDEDDDDDTRMHACSMWAQGGQRPSEIGTTWNPDSLYFNRKVVHIPSSTQQSRPRRLMVGRWWCTHLSSRKKCHSENVMWH